MPRSLIVLAGATGLLGRRLLSRLSENHEVVAVGRSVPPLAAGKWVRCDLRENLDAVDLPAHADTVISLAQSQHFRDFPAQADDIFAINVGAVERLLRWALAHGVRRFVHASSGGLYGSGERPFAEDSPLQPSDDLGFYLASKRCAELLVESYAGLMSVVIVRPFFVYGPGQKPGMLVPRLVRSVMEGRPITLQGPDGIRLNPIHVDDAAAAVAASLVLEGSHKINIAGPDVLTLRQIGETIGASLARPVIFSPSPGEPRHLVGDIRRMRELLGAPATPFAAGIADYISALTDHGEG